MVVDYINSSNMLKLSFNNGSSTETVSHIFIRSINDFLRLYKASTWYRDEDGNDDLYTPYVGEAKRVFDEIVKRKSLHTKKIAVDFSKTFVTKVSGASKLVLQETRGIIQLARRNGKNITSKNCICISDNIRDKFIEDCKATAKKNRYALNIKTEEEMFNSWRTFIKNEYIRQYLEVKPQ